MVKKNDWLTASAIGVLAMCVVTFDHEALGHGSMCLALGGHIRLLTTSLFRCDVKTGWLDVAGPFTNLFMSTLALICLRFLPARLVGLRLFLITVTGFGYFWESGYVIKAMHHKFGDLYFAADYFLGEPSVSLRVMAAIAGLILYLFTIRLTAQALLKLWPDAAQARAIARTLWFAAAMGSAFAALAYQRHDWGNFRDSVLEIGLASFPFLFIPIQSRKIADSMPVAVLERSYRTIALAALVYVVFVATMGRGIVS